MKFKLIGLIFIASFVYVANSPAISIKELVSNVSGKEDSTLENKLLNVLSSYRVADVNSDLTNGQELAAREELDVLMSERYLLNLTKAALGAGVTVTSLFFLLGVLVGHCPDDSDQKELFTKFMCSTASGPTLIVSAGSSAIYAVVQLITGCINSCRALKNRYKLSQLKSFIEMARKEMKREEKVQNVFRSDSKS